MPTYRQLHSALMRVRVAGIGLDVGPDHELTVEDRALLDRIDQGRECEEPEAAFALRLEPDTMDASRLPKPAPAQILWDGSRIVICHPQFGATIWLDSRTAVMRRSREDLFPLRITLRVLLAAELPSQGALPLHAAGVVLGKGGVICFGASGAGKTTISSVATTPVLSDELTVAWISDPSMSATGLLENDVVRPAAPLSALIALDRGPDFELQPLAWSEAIRSLLHVAMVPSAPSLWRQVITLVSELAQTVPSYRLAWSPEVPVWRHIADALNIGPTQYLDTDNQLEYLQEQVRSCI
jgi:hypothetical protein